MSSTIDADAPAGGERFDIVRRVGTGSMGAVYEVLDRERDRVVALKVLKQIDADALYRFKREFRGISGIVHPNLVTLYELGSHGEQWFFTMELVRGCRLLEYVYPRTEPAGAEPRVALPADGETATVVTKPAREEGVYDPAHLDVDRLRHALCGLAQGLAALHSARRLHRDVKPSNVLVAEEDGRVVLCDFGLIGEMSADGVLQTRHEHIAGTIAYMSPEQAAVKPMTAASDWYSVGVTLYQCLTGTLPLHGEARAVLVKKRSFTPPPVQSVNPNAPDDLSRLCDALLQLTPADRPTASQVLARLGVTREPPLVATATASAGPFVGRDGELAQLRAAFDDSLDHSVSVFAHALSGVGKSALLETFVQELEADERALVLCGRCYESESVRYKAFDHLIDQLTAHLLQLPDADMAAVMPAHVASLARLFPILRKVPLVDDKFLFGGDVRDPQELRRRAFAALRELLGNLATQRPLVVMIDDLQWGDDDSGRLLLELQRPPDGPRMLFLGSYRTDEAEASPLLQLLLGSRASERLVGDVRELAIETLSADACRELVRSLLADESVPDATVEDIARESGGNPFWINELVRYVRAGASLEGGHVTLDQLLTERVDSLPRPVRDVLSAVAVAGRPVPFTVVRRASGCDADLHDTLAVLRSHRLVRSIVVGGHERLESYHDRVREGVRAAMDADVQRAWHEKLARAYEHESVDADPEVLFEHWNGAGDERRTGTYAVRAADAAAAAFAFERAARGYRLALEVGGYDEAQVRVLHRSLGDALANAGRGAEAADEFLAATTGASAAEIVDLKSRAAKQLLHTGHFDRGTALWGEVLRSVGLDLQRSPRRALFGLLRRRAWLRLRGYGFARKDTSELSAAELSHIDTLWDVSIGLSMTDTTRAKDFQVRHLLAALRAGEPYRVACGFAAEASFVATAGGGVAARVDAVSKRALELAEELGDPHALGMQALCDGAALFLRGEWKKAKDQCARGEQILRDRCTGVGWELATAQFFYFSSAFYLGELDLLATAVPDRLREALDRGNTYAAAGLRSGRTAWAWLAADQPEEARRQLARAQQEWSQSGFHLQHYYELVASTQTELYERNSAAAWKLVQDRWDVLSRSLLQRVQNVRIESHYLRGRAAIARFLDTGDDALLTLAHRSAGKMRKDRMPWGDALAQLLLGAIALRRDQRDRAIAHLEGAADSARAANMAMHVAVAEYALGRLRDSAAAETALTTLGTLGARNPAAVIDVVAPGLTP